MMNMELLNNTMDILHQKRNIAKFMHYNLKISEFDSSTMAEYKSEVKNFIQYRVEQNFPKNIRISKSITQASDYILYLRNNHASEERINSVLNALSVAFKIDRDLIGTSYSQILFPTKCNLCGGDVIFTSNALIYGKEYGSGKMYYCTQCYAYVGTHKPRPKEAMGILANQEMRELKKKCHAIFDKKWRTESTSKRRFVVREEAYKQLAVAIGIEAEKCHFGYFDTQTLIRAYEILKEEQDVLSANE